MEQWEYEVLAVSWDRGNETWQVSGPMEFAASTLVEAFNRMGEAGWEGVSLTPYIGEVLGSLPGKWEALNYRAIFKRRKQ